MRKIILLFAFITLFSCNTNKLEGVYTYQETETKKVFGSRTAKD